MPAYSKLTLIGHVGHDPETRQLPSGDKVTAFSVATSERRKDGSEHTTWYRASAFGQLGERASQYLRKGSLVYLEGPLNQSAYVDHQGEHKSSLDIRVREMRLLSKQSEEKIESGSGAEQSTPDSTVLDIGF